MVQSYWCRKHLTSMSDCFQLNSTQRAIVVWLQLPRLMLPQKLAEKVLGWKEHALADFQEQVTLYMPSRVVHLYLEVCTSFHVHFREKVPAMCQHRNDIGLLCCDAHVGKQGGIFCSWKHSSQQRQRVLAHFNGDEYGTEYLVLDKGDMVVVKEHPESGSGWSFALSLRTKKHGWLPTDYVTPQ